jgi:hypothetical protein
MKGGMILAILGGVGLLLSLCVTGVFLLLPVINAGKTDFDEAALGFVPGGCCSGLFMLMVIGGVVWMIVGKKPPAPRV